MLEKQHQPIAFELAKSAKNQNHQILYLCDSDKEARLIKNELKLFMNDSEIGYAKAKPVTIIASVGHAAYTPPFHPDWLGTPPHSV